MDHLDNQSRFPEEHESTKLHGTHDITGEKEKYLRDSGKIEDMPSQSEVKKMNAEAEQEESTHLTDRSGEEKREDYINTDERRNDIEKTGF